MVKVKGKMFCVNLNEWVEYVKKALTHNSETRSLPNMCANALLCYILRFPSCKWFPSFASICEVMSSSSYCSKLFLLCHALLFS